VRHFAECIAAAPELPYKGGGVYLLAPLARPVPAVYVGQTVAGFGRRWQEHLDDLRLGRHVNDQLRAFWRRYGDMHATVLWIGHKSQARPMELWWMRTLRARGYRLANEVG
jgi:hypothetical protein